MTRVFNWRTARLLSAALLFAAVLAWAAPRALGQAAPPETAQQPSESSTPAPPRPEAEAPSDEPLTIITMQRKN